LASRSKRASQSRSAVNAAGKALRVTSWRFNGGRAYGSRGRRQPITNVSKDDGGEHHHHDSGESATDRRWRRRSTSTSSAASRSASRVKARRLLLVRSPANDSDHAHGVSFLLGVAWASPAHRPRRPLCRQRPAPSTNRLSDSVGTSVLV